MSRMLPLAVTIPVAEEANSIPLSHDTMASLLTPLWKREASEAARDDLHKKIESLLIDIAH
jgi:hypothetical protein